MSSITYTTNLLVKAGLHAAQFYQFAQHMNSQFEDPDGGGPVWATNTIARGMRLAINFSQVAKDEDRLIRNNTEQATETVIAVSDLWLELNRPQGISSGARKVAILESVSAAYLARCRLQTEAELIQRHIDTIEGKQALGENSSLRNLSNA